VKINYKIIGAIVFLAFGIVMAFVCGPNCKKVMLVEQENYEPQIVADWIVERAGEFILLNIGSGAKELGLLGGQDVDMQTIQNRDFYQRLTKLSHVFVISESIDQMNEAVVFLRRKNIQAFGVEGGLFAWKKDVLYPENRVFENEEQRQEFLKRVSVANYLLGKTEGMKIDTEVAPVKKEKIKFKYNVSTDGGSGGC